MREEIEEWLRRTSAPEFLSDLPVSGLTVDYLIDMVLEAGAEYILNDNLIFHIRYMGTTRGVNFTTWFHEISLRTLSDNKILYSKIHDVSTRNP